MTLELKADYEFMKFTNASHLSIKWVPTSRIPYCRTTENKYGMGEECRRRRNDDDYSGRDVVVAGLCCL